jgi:hypothetical protein
MTTSRILSSLLALAMGAALSALAMPAVAGDSWNTQLPATPHRTPATRSYNPYVTVDALEDVPAPRTRLSDAMPKADIDADLPAPPMPSLGAPQGSPSQRTQKIETFTWSHKVISPRGQANRPTATLKSIKTR